MDFSDSQFDALGIIPYCLGDFIKTLKAQEVISRAIVLQ